ncbi:phage head closure protein [Allorhizobium pseudoryzae]|uniref:phage head closure protein n=1 Tax=Allorhizobium pseudoryzae TaxID=379684 RepID=UPI003D071EA7
MERVTFDVGAMTARLVREVPVDTPDGQGGAVRGWVEAGKLWARIEPVSQRAETMAAGAERVTVTHRIWISAFAVPAAGERLVKGARLFAIKAVRDPDETGRFLVCDCEEAAR